MSERRTNFQELSQSDLEVDCAEVVPPGRVPLLGLHNTPKYDSVEGRMYTRDPTSDSPRYTDLQAKQRPASDVFDSGMGMEIGDDEGVFSIDEGLESLHVSEEGKHGETVLSQKNTNCLKSTRASEKTDSSQSIDEDRAYFSGPSMQYPSSENWNCLLRHAFEQDEDGDTKLHLAIIQPVPELVYKFIDLCPSPDYLNLQNTLQQTPLHLAVLTRQPYVARKLVSMGANLETRDRNGNTSLHLACKIGDRFCVQALTAPIEETEKENLPYHPPVQSIPQNMSLKNYDGETCLHVAAASGNIELVHFLIHNCQADINSQEGKSGRTILHQAVEANNYQLVSYLLQQPNLNIEASTYDMSTPLKLAYGRRFSSVMSLLMKAGADSTVLDGEDSGTDSDDEMMDSFICNDNIINS